MSKLTRVLRRRKWRLVAAVGLVVVGAIVYFVRPSQDPRSGSEVVSDGRVAIGDDISTAYRIAYRVETTTDGDTSTSVERIAVRRPFESRLSGQEAELDQVTAFGRLTVRDEVFAVPPAIPAPDRRPDAVLEEAIRDGYADERESRRVARRTCRVFRIAESADAASLPKLRRGAGDYTDVCIDEAGLVLEEATYEADELARRRVATRVDDDVDFDDDAFDIAAPEGDAQRVGSVRELAEDSPVPGDRYWALERAPNGFKLHGRYAVVPPAQPGFTDVTAQGSIVAFVSEVWTNGIDLVVIDQGGTQGAPPFGEDRNARQVEAGDLGEGELRYSLRESEARFLTGGVGFLRVRGTVAPSRLLAIARSLEETPGGDLRFVDD